MKQYDVIIIGAGAAGLMCAKTAAKRGKTVAIIEHTRKIGEKIRISGGGRCNFTNLYCSPKNFLSENPHFCKSALSRYTQHDFIAEVKAHGIPYHEKTYEEKTGNQNARGQLFCDRSALDIIDLLRDDFTQAGGVFHLETKIHDLHKEGDLFRLATDQGAFACAALVIATGGLSIPKIGATNFAYETAKRFGLSIVTPAPALVPLTFAPELLEKTQALAGVAVDAQVRSGDGDFREGTLFTHRGVSGPAILQISSYWREGEPVTINLTPDLDIFSALKNARNRTPKKQIRTILSEFLPARLSIFIEAIGAENARIADLSDSKLQRIAETVQSLNVTPNGTEGYRTAEVTRGGVNTSEISSKTFEAKTVQGLYFIGEALDVTGHLGGHNFQWAWSSGYCAGVAV